ncbi:MAG TPA: single-stranded DNA-binding protein [Micromonosporaceae bacterium]|jgi:single-strand DNA-binding protein
MYDLRVPIVGTVLTQPERRIIEKTGAAVTSFRIVMNYRRYDRETQQWIDWALFRVRVVCWRRLADHVFGSIKVGEPVIVIGRIFTREWRSETGEVRVNYEVEADAVGHDLSRGVSAFTKMRLEAPQSVVEDDEADSRIGGELSYQVDANGVPVPHDPADSDVAAETAADALAILRQAGMTDTDTPGEPSGGGDDEDDDELVGAGAGGRRRRGR